MIGSEFIFIHINRTGGTSVEASLKNYGSHKNRSFWRALPQSKTLSQRREVLENFGFFHPQHFTADEYRRVLGNREYNKRFVFTIVRNPWDRMLSHYAYSYKNKVDREDFNDWILETFLKPKKYDLPCSKKPNKCKNHSRLIMPCADWLTKAKVDFIARFENYDADVQKIHIFLEDRTKDNLEDLVEIEQKLKSSSKFCDFDYHYYYSDKSKLIIEKNFLSDIKTFGYHY